MADPELFTKEEIELIKLIFKTFPASEMVVFFATEEQIQQLKDAGLTGISRSQKK